MTLRESMNNSMNNSEIRHEISKKHGNFDREVLCRGKYIVVCVI